MTPRAIAPAALARAAALGAAVLAALFAALFAAGTARAQGAATVTVRDDRGVTLSLVRAPQRIVTLLPSLTETVCALGACARLVGTDRYSNHPAAVLGLPKLGGMDDAQVEGIVALRPDLVLAARSTRAVARLEALGLRVLAFDSDTHAQVHSSLLRIGRLLGGPGAAADAAAGEAHAQAVWAAAQAQIDAAAQRVPPAWRGRSVYFEVDATPYAAGAGSFVGETLTRLALRNIAPPALGAFPKLNPEFVVRAQPEVVLAAARNLAAMPARPGWAGLRALQQGRRCALDGPAYELVTRPGPRLGEAALALADCLAALPPPEAAR